jgi:hypothetical protein
VDKAKPLQKKCIVQQLPEKDEVYGIMLIDDYNHREGEIKKAYRVSPLKFIFQKETILTVLFIFVAFALSVFDILAIAVSVVMFSFYLYMMKPYASKRKISRAKDSFRILNTVTILAYIIFYINIGKEDLGFQLIEDVMIGGMFAHILFIFLEKMNRYTEVYAIGVESKQEWKKAKEFIWTGKK